MTVTELERYVSILEEAADNWQDVTYQDARLAQDDEVETWRVEL
jgi:hypothetical protein